MLPFDKIHGNTSKQEDDRWTEQLATSKKKRDWAYKEETRRMTFGINAKPGLFQRDRPSFHKRVFVHESIITMGNLDEVDFWGRGYSISLVDIHA